MAKKIPVNGFMCSFAEMTISMDGDVDSLVALKEIKYDDAVDGADHVFGPGSSVPIGTTKGRSKPTCSAVLLRWSWELFAAEHLKDIPGGYTTKTMSITVSYTIDNGDIRTDTIKNARITKVSGGGSDGTDAAEVSIEFLPMGVEWHGGIRMVA